MEQFETWTLVNNIGLRYTEITVY